MKQLRKLSTLTDRIDEATEALEEIVTRLDSLEDVTSQAYFIRDEVLPKMDALRVPCDEAETTSAAKYWPFPTYGELLFSVK